MLANCYISQNETAMIYGSAVRMLYCF